MDYDTIFEILRNPIRRQIAAVLHDKDEISRDRLTAVLMTAEADGEDEAKQVRRRIRLNLYHNHLPRMADADLIKYDEEMVAPTPRLKTVAQSLPLPDLNRTSARV